MVLESSETPTLDCQSTNPSLPLALGMEAKGPVLHPSKPPIDVPNSFGPSRWPGFSAAFDFCNKAVEKFPPMSSTLNKYLFLRDLNDYLTEGHVPVKCLGVYHRAKQAEFKLKRFGFRQLADVSRCSDDDKQIMIDGTIEFNEELPIEESIANKLYYASNEYKKEIVGLSVDDIARKKQKNERALRNMINKNIIKRNEILETVKEHHFAMRSLIKLLGLSEKFFNPTIPGRTWLCIWRCVNGFKIDEKNIENDIALVIAGPNDILQPDMILLLCRTQDIDEKDRDLLVTKLQGDVLLLNEEQRLSWGYSLNSIGRVYWAVSPGFRSLNRQKKFKKKIGRPRKEKAANSASLVEPLPEGSSSP